MSDHLSATGVHVSRVTNAASFDHQISHITYRPGARTAAVALRDALPPGIEVQENAAQDADVRLTLGADLIGLDQQLAAKQARTIVESRTAPAATEMAVRMRTYLRGEELAVHRITNADHFEHKTTAIFYRSGHRAHAQELAAKLPVPVRLLEDRALTTDLRLEMGHDLLGFDAAQAERSQPPEPG